MKYLLISILLFVGLFFAFQLTASSAKASWDPVCVKWDTICTDWDPDGNCIDTDTICTDWDYVCNPEGTSCSGWSGCSALCGGGTQTRTCSDTCDSWPEQQSCNTQSCCVGTGSCTLPLGNYNQCSGDCQSQTWNRSTDSCGNCTSSLLSTQTDTTCGNCTNPYYCGDNTCQDGNNVWGYAEDPYTCPKPPYDCPGSSYQDCGALNYLCPITRTYCQPTCTSSPRSCYDTPLCVDPVDCNTQPGGGSYYCSTQGGGTCAEAPWCVGVWMCGAGGNCYIDCSGCTSGATHMACQGTSCTSVSGSGPNTCASSADCSSSRGYYYACSGTSCVRVSGSGQNRCASSADCTTTATPPPAPPPAGCTTTPLTITPNPARIGDKMTFHYNFGQDTYITSNTLVTPYNYLDTWSTPSGVTPSGVNNCILDIDYSLPNPLINRNLYCDATSAVSSATWTHKWKENSVDCWLTANYSTQPTCNTDVSLSVSPNPANINSPINFRISGNASTFVGDVFGGPGVVNSCGGNWDNQTCTALLSGNNYTWTHTWKNCVGNLNNCSDTCTATTPFSITSGPPLPTPSSSLLCIDSGYNGNGYTISWGASTRAVTDVTISKNSTFSGEYYFESVTFTNSGGNTDAPAGFRSSIGGPDLTFEPSTTYYVRLWDGTEAGPTAAFTTPVVCLAPWIQTSGDVHSNTRIDTPGGP